MKKVIRTISLLLASFFLSMSLTIALSLPVIAETPNDPNLKDNIEQKTPEQTAPELTSKTPETTIPTPAPLDQPPTPTFSDVEEDNPHYVAILQLAKDGLINGLGDGEFHSRNEISRAEALKIIMEFLGKFDETKYKEPETPPFPDVEMSQWYTPYIVTAKEDKITTGYPDGTFRPDATVSLAEALTMIAKSLDNYISITPDEAEFKDVPADAWYAEYVKYASDRDMLNINADNTINPEQTLNRGEFADLIYKLKYFGEGYHFGKATYYGKAVQGHNTASGIKFDMNALTAAHKTLPFGTIVEVTNLANGKKVSVKITDRGPYGPGRVLDLSSGAFKLIADLSSGIANIQFQIIEEPTQ